MSRSTRANENDDLAIDIDEWVIKVKFKYKERKNRAPSTIAVAAGMFHVVSLEIEHQLEIWQPSISIDESESVIMDTESFIGDCD
jgi:hypothetical protein